MAAGTMIALAASVGDIDTSDQAVVFEAYQKALIVNGSILRVTDFGNTKLTCVALTNPPAHGDILTQDQTGGNYAYMVVDFVNTAKTMVYGYAYYGGAATAFNITNAVTSNNATATMDASFTPTAVDGGTPAGGDPHWYTWTPYPDIVLSIAAYGQEIGSTKSFGSMPDKAYLGCLYRGRPVLSGDPEHPQQWYMGRQSDVWDWAYIANDAGTPVAGGNADAGEVGDIVRALIPYKDDYLVFGCSTSIWFLAGDPAEGGSLNELSLTAGILGSKSFTWDKNDNLFIMGTNGILRIPPGFGPPQNLTQESYPDFIKDLAFDSSLHRVTMEYDRQRHGLMISKTTLADGTNECWWYDLKSNGLFPETYPEECGAYSMFYYDSNDPDHRGMLVGCRDGYIRVHSDDQTDDDVGATDEAISSHVALGPMKLSDGDREGSLDTLAVETVGGDVGGAEVDSDNITYKVFAERSADGTVEKMVANTNPKIAGTINGPGRPRGDLKRRKVKSVYAAIRLQHGLTGKTWGLEKVIINGKKKGRVK